MLLALHPELVDMDRGEPGYTGDLQSALGTAFRSGVHATSPNEVVGDPARASADHGKRYWEAVEKIASEAVSQP